MQLSMFSSEEPPAKASRSQDFAAEWLTLAETSRSSILQLLTVIGPAGFFGRTSPVSCHLTGDATLAPSSEGWQNSGIMRPGECLTLSTCEWTAIPAQCPSDDGVCSLSDVLETGELPRQYFLSARACKGILRRAENRGKELPSQLRRALEQVGTRPAVIDPMGPMQTLATA